MPKLVLVITDSPGVLLHLVGRGKRCVGTLVSSEVLSSEHLTL